MTHLQMTNGSGQSRVRLSRGLLATAMCIVLTGCGGGLTGSAGGPSMGDRFSQLFGTGSSSGSNAQLVGTPPVVAGAAPAADINCPGVAIRDGAGTLQVGTQGRTIASNDDLRYQGTIVRNARDCNMLGGQINARVGIQGRIVAGPAGSPPTVDVPIRVAVVQEGVQPKTIVSKLYRTTVDMSGGDSVPFSFVAEDVTFPAPAPGVADSYVFYIGFDPEGAKPPPARARGAKKG